MNAPRALPLVITVDAACAPSATATQNPTDASTPGVPTTPDVPSAPDVPSCPRVLLPRRSPRCSWPPPSRPSTAPLVASQSAAAYAPVDGASFGALRAPLPRYVHDELHASLRCGVLACGFARARCPGCGRDKLVAFSCKKRGVCPSCGGRRMSETAAEQVT